MAYNRLKSHSKIFKELNGLKKAKTEVQYKLNEVIDTIF